MFFTNIFSFSERRAVCEHAYKAIRRDLLARYDELAPLFARHGITLRRDVLEEERGLWDGVFRDRPHQAAAPPDQSGHPPARRRAVAAGWVAGCGDGGVRGGKHGRTDDRDSDRRKPTGIRP